MSLYIGVDPGATGAIAFVTDQGWLAEVHDMPYVDGHVVAPLVAGLCRQPDVRAAMVERAQSFPGGGVAGMFRYGTGYGVVLGVLGALEIPVETVPPAKWKRHLGLSRDKGACRRRAAELWPLHAQSFARAKDDGRAEAALLGLYAQLRHRHPVAP